MKTLYISYDGIADPLGQSQIVPYLKGISKKANIHVISFEKKHSSSEYIDNLVRDFDQHKITWDRLVFSNKKGFFFKAYDFFVLHKEVLKYLISSNIDVIHSRGLPPAITATFMGLFFRVKLLFDMRGLWADERITKGGWSDNNWIDKFQYKIFKQLERFVIKRSSRVVTLTESVIDELEKIQPGVSEKITTIPCAADFRHFSPEHDLKRAELKLNGSDFILGYLGSVGPLYQFDKFLDLFKVLKINNENIKALIVTNNLNEASDQIKKSNLSLTDSNLILTGATRAEVSGYINCMDVMVSFCTNAYSAKGASPTKIGEALACGVPVLSNKGIGDTDTILSNINGGMILPQLESNDFSKYTKQIMELKLLKSKDLSQRAKRIFDLEIAINKYLKVYETF